MTSLIFDSHCHVHSENNLAELGAAVGRFNTDAALGMCLVELAGSSWFERLQTGAASVPGFSVQLIDDISFKLQSDSHSCLVLKGEQVNTSERLEVIVIGCRERIEEGKPLQRYLDAYSDSNLLMIPWGVGKWLGARGALVSSMLRARNENKQSFVLGDNGGRPRWWKVPQFELARSLGVPVLTGSDPLNVASYGMRSLAYRDEYEALDMNGAQDWIQHVKSGNSGCVSGGSLSSTFRFLNDQISLRLNKRKANR